ncbi:hypothetical protein FM102_07410 [Corynebacterium glutamicum]|nr:hypothetical protein FM102_07410 [Corynebacterium glutamicum]
MPFEWFCEQIVTIRFSYYNSPNCVFFEVFAVSALKEWL